MDILEKLSSNKTAPCITISLNTHRTHPDNLKDSILLKNLVREAELRLIEDFGKRGSEELIQKLKDTVEPLNMSFNLDSMHIFISPDMAEVVKLPLPMSEDTVQIGAAFAVRPLLKALNRTENYLIMLLSRGGTRMFEAVNDQIIHEVETHDFPFPENQWYGTSGGERANATRVDNQEREYMNVVDKAVVALHQDTGLECVVISVADSFHILQQVADKPGIYLGHVDKNYKEIANHQLAADAWEMVSNLLSKRRKEAIAEMRKAIGQSKVVTDLGEIYRAAKEGRGDMLIMRSDFRQAVNKIDEYTIELVNNGETPEVDDITSELAMEVYSKGGRVVFADADEVDSEVHTALKVRH